jgi:hypothetical protein
MAQTPIFNHQVSFAAGELSPALAARVDLSKFLTGLKTARNVNVMPGGGVRNRAGTKFVAAAGDSTHQVRLIPFSASESQTYVIELGHYYARFYTNGGQVQVSAANAWSASGTFYPVGTFVSNGGTIYYCITANTSGSTFSGDAAYWRAQTVYQIVTPWASTDIFMLKFAQSADVMYFAHQSYAPQTLTFYSSTNWQIAAYSFLSGPFMDENTGQSNTITPSAATVTNTNVPITYISGGTWGSSSQVNPITVNVASVSNLSVGQAITVTGMNGTFATQLNGNKFYILSITTLVPGSSYLITLSYTPGGQPVYPAPAVSAQEYVPTSSNLEISGTITLSASANVFVSGHVGALFQLVSTIIANTITFSPTGTGQTSAAVQCGHNWSIITSGAWVGQLNVQASIDGGTTWSTIQALQSAAVNDNFTTSGDTGFDQCLIRVTSSGTWTSGGGGCVVDLSTLSFDWIGVVQITSVSSPLSATATILPIGKNDTGLANTNATWQWSEGSWSTYRGWPGSVCFNNDRLCWGGTPTEPQTEQLSRTGSYNDFSTSEPAQADDAFSIVLPSRTLNAIQNIVMMPQGQLALTTDSEWLIQPGTQGLSASSVSTLLQGVRGSSAIAPAIIGIEMMVIQRMGSVMRNLIYQLAVNGYMGDNISIISQHLFTGYTISEMAYAQEPDSILWTVRSDGALLSCTYMRDQELNAWTHHDTQGTFESICTIPDYTDGYSQPWFVVNRTLNGQTVRCIEYMVCRDMGTDPRYQYFVDCGSTYNGAATASITGLGWLANMPVAVLADGNVVNGLTVSAGGVLTLPAAASIVQVGLPFVSDIETLRIESPSPFWVQPPGTAQGRKIAIPQVTLRFWNSRGGWIRDMSQTTPDPASTGTDGFLEIKQRYASDPPAAAMPLKTMDYPVQLGGGYEFGAHMMLRQVDPLPMCLLAFFPKCVYGEN